MLAASGISFLAGIVALVLAIRAPNGEALLRWLLLAGLPIGIALAFFGAVIVKARSADPKIRGAIAGPLGLTLSFLAVALLLAGHWMTPATPASGAVPITLIGSTGLTIAYTAGALGLALGMLAMPAPGRLGTSGFVATIASIACLLPLLGWFGIRIEPAQIVAIVIGGAVGGALMLLARRRT